MNETIIKVEYRNWLNGLPPQRIKLDIGENGWAGENTWKVAQPWHCKPSADACTYGIEIIYNWQTPCTVTCDDKGISHFDGDFTNEKPKYLGDDWHPFATFAPYHFGYVAMVDIKTPPGYGLLLQPHPRVFACRDGSTPIAVPGLLEMDWWPEIFFMVFKAPMPNCKYVFKQGDPIASCLVVPKNIKYDISPMSKKEASLREARQYNLEKYWNRLCTRIFYCDDGDEYFDNKYKVLSNIARREGLAKVGEYMDDPKKIPHYYLNPQVIDNRPEDKRNCHHAPWTEEQLKRFEDKNKATEKPEEEKPKEKKPKARKPQPSKPGKPEPSYEIDYVDENLGEVDELIAKANDFNTMSEEEFEKLIAAFKRQKRKLRLERSLKLKSKSDPKKIFAAKHPGEEWVLGHRIEKLKT